MDRIKAVLTRIWQGLTWKNGQFSKTAFFMSVGTFVAISQWFFLGFLEGLETHGFVLPAFNYVANTMMLATLAGLYLTNHKIRASTSESGVELETGGDDKEE